MMAFLIIIGSVGAISMPTPISGKIVNDGYLAGYSVKITNLDSRNQDTITLTTDESGWFMTDWGNNGFTDFSTGDKFRIEVGGLIKEIVMIDKIDDREGSMFDLRGVVIPKEKPCPVCEVCKTCETCSICDVCLPQSPCDACCPENPTCPEPTDPTIPMILAAASTFGLGVGAVYLKLYKTAVHLHKGISNYHSIYTSHQNPDIRHPRGENMPKYVQINGKWKYEG